MSCFFYSQCSFCSICVCFFFVYLIHSDGSSVLSENYWRKKRYFDISIASWSARTVQTVGIQDSWLARTLTDSKR